MPRRPSATKTATVQSVERAAAALQVFFEEGRPLTVTEVSARTGLAPATTHRLLATFVKTGWIEQDSRSARYELSGMMLGNAALAIASSPLLLHAQQYLSRVSEATGLNSFLAVLIKRGSVLLAKIHGRDGSLSDFQVGKTLPLHASASGKLFLAYMDEKEREEILRRQGGLKRITQNTIVEPEALMLELEAIRQQGYAIDRKELYETYRSVAVPVRKADGRVAAALCAGGWSNDASEDLDNVLLRELIPAAEELSQLYGQFEPW